MGEKAEFSVPHKLFVTFWIKLACTIRWGTDAHDRSAIAVCSLPRLAYMTKRLKYCCRWRPCSETSLLRRLSTALKRWSLRLRLSQPWCTNMENNRQTTAELHQSKVQDEKPLSDNLWHKLLKVSSRKLVIQTASSMFQKDLIKAYFSTELSLSLAPTWVEGPGEAVGEGQGPSCREKWAMKTMSLANAPRTSALGHSSRYSENRLGYANRTLCANQ